MKKIRYVTGRLKLHYVLALFLDSFFQPGLCNKNIKNR